jgi:hypothetical protein
MKDEAFERTMEEWAEQEQAAVPSMRPTHEMYRMVEAKQKRGGLFSAGLPRWARVAVTVASVLLAALAYSQLYLPSPVVSPAVAVVRVREAFPSDKGPVITPPPTARYGAPKRELPLLDALDLQYCSSGVAGITALDLRQPTADATVLAATDSYRLALQPARDSYVYVYQQSSSSRVEQLFPNDAYILATNPLREGETYYLPSPPGGFHVEAQAGEQRLYVVAATDPLPELLLAYESYAEAADQRARQRALAALLEALDGIEEAYPDQAGRWAFGFVVR